MLLKLVSAMFLLVTGPAFALTSLNPAMTTQQIQSAISSAPSGSTISFTPGNYTITAPLAIPCSNLQITGPVATPSTAILSATFPNDALFAYPGNCVQLGSISYIGIVSNGGVYLGIGNNANFTFTHNQVTGLVTAAGVFFDGTLSTTLTNATIQYNTFGNSNSCAAIFSSSTDMGGYCAGVITSLGSIKGLTISNNTFNHVEEGIHLNQMSNWNPGGPGSVCITCVIEYNSVLNYHRIGIEVQVGTPTDPIMFRHNAVIDPLNSSYGTFAVSLACCQWGNTMATDGISPGFIFDDNLLIASQPCGLKCPPYGVEFWGNGSQGLNSLVQGTFSNGYTWGYGAGAWAINNNYICGPNYVNSTGSYYISNQQHQNNPPNQIGNVTGPTCSARGSTTPTIAPATGSFVGSLSVAMADSGANTSIWYTTDGTTPVPGKSILYTAPFTISKTTTVKAVGMWGGPNQPVSYPSGYGYMPSGVFTANYTLNNPANCINLKLNVQTGVGTSTMSGTFTSTPIACN